MPPVSLFISNVQKEFQDERRAVRAFAKGDPPLRRYFRAFLSKDLPARDRRADDREGGAVWYTGGRCEHQ